MTDDGRMIRNGVDVLGLMGYFQNTESKPTALNYLLSLFVNRTSNLTENMFNTQVGSPAVRLRLARCTAWAKRWSEAMDFLQTIFKQISPYCASSRIIKPVYQWG